MLDKLQGGLIVSVQATAVSALDDSHVLAAMARAVQDAGAAGVRLQGVENIEAARKRVTVPVIGLIKREYPGFEPYITPTLKEVNELLATGVEIIAFDATLRPHPAEPIEEFIQAIHTGGALAMADCATEADGEAALAAGADILATTLAGYTNETLGVLLPDLSLVKAFSSCPAFAIAEGGIHTPEQAHGAFNAGADAIVVGTAITNLEWLTRRFL